MLYVWHTYFYYGLFILRNIFFSLFFFLDKHLLFIQRLERKEKFGNITDFYNLVCANIQLILVRKPPLCTSFMICNGFDRETADTRNKPKIIINIDSNGVNAF